MPYRDPLEAIRSRHAALLHQLEAGECPACVRRRDDLRFAALLLLTALAFFAVAMGVALFLEAAPCHGDPCSGFCT